MDPNNSNLQKLEEDLQNLSQNAPAPEAAPQTSVNITQPVAPDPQVPDQEPVQSPPVAPKSGSPIVTVAIVLGVVALLAIVAYVIGAMYMNKTVKPVVCTAEARVCDDGTSVGRIGPNCEFEACPTFVPVATETPLGTASASATPISSPVATLTPTSSPSAIPAY